MNEKCRPLAVRRHQIIVLLLIKDGAFETMGCNQIIASPFASLTDEDYAELKLLGLTDSQILKLGHFSATDKNAAKREYGINHRGLCFQYRNPIDKQYYFTSTGRRFFRMKPRDWDETWEDPIDEPPKYLSPKDSGNRPYFSGLLQHFSRLAVKTNIAIDVTEGEKKADVLAAHGIFSCGLAGVYGWLDRESRIEEMDIPPAPIIEDDEDAQEELDEKLPESRIIPELADALEWKHRRVNLVFDSDFATNPQVKKAIEKFAIALVGLGAQPYIVRLPNEIDGSKNGADDFIVRHGIEAYRILQAIGQPALGKKLKLALPADPKPYYKIILAWTCLKESWRYRAGVGWYRWNGAHWELRPDEEFETELVSFQDAQGWKEISNQDAITKQLKTRLLIRGEEWNKEGLLGFKNGFFDSTANTFVGEHHRENFLTSALPYDFDPDAKCPTWQNFLDQSLQGDREAVGILQAFIKWVLIPKPKDRKAEIEKCLDIMGPKGTGKGTFLDVVTALVGSTNCGKIGSRTLKDIQLIANLLDKKVSIAYDAFGFQTDVGLFNEVVSNEPIEIKKVYKEPVTVRLCTTIIRAYNRILEAPDGSEGLDRRIIAISFNHKPQEVDLDLASKLQAELPGIFQWAWSISRSEMRQRLLWAGNSTNVLEASTKRFEANNPEFGFLKDCFPDGNEQVKASHLYSSYVDWSKQEGLSPKKNRKFAEAIQALGCRKLPKGSDGCHYYEVPNMSNFDVAEFLGLNKKIISEKFQPSTLRTLRNPYPDSIQPSVQPSANPPYSPQPSVTDCNETQEDYLQYAKIVASPNHFFGQIFPVGAVGNRHVRLMVGEELLVFFADNLEFCPDTTDNTETTEGCVENYGGLDLSTARVTEGTEGLEGFSEKFSENEKIETAETTNFSFLKEAKAARNTEVSKPEVINGQPFHPVQQTVIHEFMIGTQVKKKHEPSFMGRIREVDGEFATVFWGEYAKKAKTNTIVREPDGSKREITSRHHLSDLKIVAPASSTLYTSRNLPKKGDVFENFRGHTGIVTCINRSNPKYTVKWHGCTEASYTLQELEVMNCRRIGYADGSKAIPQ